MEQGRLRHGTVSTTALAILISILLLILLIFVCGCGSDSPTDVSQQITTTTPATATTTGDTTASTVIGQGTVSFTDQGGRQVTVPQPIESVFCTSPIGTNLMYMLAPDMLVGWNVTPTDLEKQYIPEQYREYIGLGGWYGKNTTGNVEEIIKRAPDVVFDMGTIDNTYIDSANRTQELLNTPVVMVDGSLTESGDALRYVGKLIGREERAEQLAAYCDTVVQEAQAIAAELTDDQKVKVYYAEGAKGLNTDPAGSQHTEVLDLVGGENVAQVEIDAAGYGMSPVSLEQVIAWNPDVILVASDPTEESTAYQEITTRSEWSTINAVKNKRVYQIPRGPFDWFDRPPCISRIIGIRWLGNLLYPDLYTYDIKSEVKEFYKLFYQIDLTDAQYDQLMVRAGGTASATSATTSTTTDQGSTAEGSGTATVKGLVDNPMTITGDMLKKMNMVTTTMDHPKLGEMEYSGVRWSELLPLLEVQAAATTVDMGCTDGYIAEVTLAELAASQDSMLAVGDDGSLNAAMPGFHGKAWARDIIWIEFK